MSTLTGVDLTSPPDGLGVLAFRGADAARFLQGQLSADVDKLDDGASTLAGLHNPQGRVLALLALVRASREEILAVLPRELVPVVEQRLRKYVLRAKVRIEDLCASLRVIGAAAGEPGPAGLARISWGERALLLAPAALELDEAMPREPWGRADIAAGLPQVFTATSEAFVAQMLNLDLLGAIAFDKGCYTGQEVIARAHYRGRVKRRMQRWLNASGVALAPADNARAPDGRALTVVRVAQRPDGQQEILAIGNFAAATAPLAETPAADGTAGPEVSGPLTLPYPLPD